MFIAVDISKREGGYVASHRSNLASLQDVPDAIFEFDVETHVNQAQSMQQTKKYLDSGSSFSSIPAIKHKLNETIFISKNSRYINPSQTSNYTATTFIEDAKVSSFDQPGLPADGYTQKSLDSISPNLFDSKKNDAQFRINSNILNATSGFKNFSQSSFTDHKSSLNKLQKPEIHPSVNQLSTTKSLLTSRNSSTTQFAANNPVALKRVRNSVRKVFDRGYGVINCRFWNRYFGLCRFTNNQYAVSCSKMAVIKKGKFLLFNGFQLNKCSTSIRFKLMMISEAHFHYERWQNYSLFVLIFYFFLCLSAKRSNKTKNTSANSCSENGLISLKLPE